MRSRKVFLTLKRQALHFSTLLALTRLSINYMLRSLPTKINASHAYISAPLYSFIFFISLFNAHSLRPDLFLNKSGLKQVLIVDKIFLDTRKQIWIFCMMMLKYNTILNTLIIYYLLIYST